MVRDSRYVFRALVDLATTHHAIHRGQFGRWPEPAGGVEGTCRGRDVCDTLGHNNEVRSLGLRARPDQCCDFGFDRLATGDPPGGDQTCGIDSPGPLDSVQDLQQRRDIG